MGGSYRKGEKAREQSQAALLSALCLSVVLNLVVVVVVGLWSSASSFSSGPSSSSSSSGPSPLSRPLSSSRSSSYSSRPPSSTCWPCRSRRPRLHALSFPSCPFPYLPCLYALPLSPSSIISIIPDCRRRPSCWLPMGGTVSDWWCGLSMDGAGCDGASLGRRSPLFVDLGPQSRRLRLALLVVLGSSPGLLVVGCGRSGSGVRLRWNPRAGCRSWSRLHVALAMSSVWLGQRD